VIAIIPPDGNHLTVVAHADLDADNLRRIGDVTTIQRGGHVIPANPAARLVHHLIRAIPGDPLAAWTRTWPGRWLVALCDGRLLGPYRTRADAVRAEEEELARLILAGEWTK